MANNIRCMTYQLYNVPSGKLHDMIESGWNIDQMLFYCKHPELSLRKINKFGSVHLIDKDGFIHLIPKHSVISPVK